MKNNIYIIMNIDELKNNKLIADSVNLIIKDKEFMDFLIDKEIINSIRVETCRDIFEKNSSKFSVKYKGTSRFNNFYSVFEAVI